ncbi:lasso peptide biosynthesis B2 protein [Thermodesulfobacteriota bacterium]
MFRRNIKKIKYYHDIGLLLNVLIAGGKIAFLYKFKKSDSLLKMASVEIKKDLHDRNKDKIMGYVGLFLRIKSRLKIADTCYTYSVLMTHILRKNGIPAKIHFGVRKNQNIEGTDPTQGHCWVDLKVEHGVREFEEVFTYP